MPTAHGLQLGPSTKYAEEMRKWEAYPSQYGPGQRPYVFAEFPKRLYRAERTEKDGIKIVESFEVGNDLEERNMRSRGFYFGQDAAIKAWQDEEQDHAKLAAERAYEVRHTLSPKAAAEVEAAEAAHGARHMPTMPAGPVKRRVGRPRSVPAPG